jgi:hypothetical protein
MRRSGTHTSHAALVFAIPTAARRKLRFRVGCRRKCGRDQRQAEQHKHSNGVYPPHGVIVPHDFAEGHPHLYLRT